MTERAQILIVEDDAAMRTLLEAAIGDRHDVVACDSGAACFAAVARRRPELVLLDVGMPGLDGYTICRHLKAAGTEAPPVLFISGHDDLRSRLQGYEAGGDDYICKPFAPAELRAKIARQLEATALRRDLGAQLKEAVGAVMTTADMAGAVGVVLNFQREIFACGSYEALTERLFAAMASFQLEGCVRIAGRRGRVERSTLGPCTALEVSILDRIEAQAGASRITPLGANTCFHYGPVLLCVRDLWMVRPEGMDPDASARHGQALDNVALLLEGAMARVQALDGEGLAGDVARLAGLAGDCLALLTRIEAAHEGRLQGVQSLQDDLRRSMVARGADLGLSPAQQAAIDGLVDAHARAVLREVGVGADTHASLRQAVRELVDGLEAAPV